VSCDEVRQQLPDFVLGTLSDTEAAAVRRHVRGCAGCRADARSLDEGIALFASAAHEEQPPIELRDRVLATLGEEWRETPQARARWRISASWPALAAAIVVLAGALALTGVAQSNASRSREDAASYQHFLSALGGKDVRVATLSPVRNISFDGSAILYDSDEGQSWILVLARSPGFDQKLTVEVGAVGGRTIKVPFALQFDSDGDAWTGMVTSADISAFRQVVLRGPDGSVVARGTATG